MPTMNAIVSALRFFFIHTLNRPALARRLVRLNQPRTLPDVLSADEVGRLLDATVCLKHLAALSLAYGAGLRVAEVAALRIGDIDSTRMILRIECGKGGRDRQRCACATGPHRQTKRAGFEAGPVLETTGTGFATDEVIELGILKFEYGASGRIYRVLDTLNQLPSLFSMENIRQPGTSCSRATAKLYPFHTTEERAGKQHESKRRSQATALRGCGA